MRISSLDLFRNQWIKVQRFCRVTKALHNYQVNIFLKKKKELKSLNLNVCLSSCLIFWQRLRPKCAMSGYFIVIKSNNVLILSCIFFPFWLVFFCCFVLTKLNKVCCTKSLEVRSKHTTFICCTFSILIWDFSTERMEHDGILLNAAFITLLLCRFQTLPNRLYFK